MAKKQENKVSDLFPKPITVQMLGDKKAIIPPITVETMCAIEEKYGDLQEVLVSCFRKPLSNIGRISEIIFNMLENKDEFKDLRDFRQHFDIGAVLSMVTSIEGLVEKSLPAIQAATGALVKGKKSLGGSSSARSLSTTPDTSSKTA